MPYRTPEEILKEMVGQTFRSVEVIDDDSVVFVSTTGKGYRLYHSQDCCESVVVESVAGDLQDLVGSPLTLAEEVSSEGEPARVSEWTDDSFTWTFYKFATIKGYVDIRFYGTSNGYYSESVDVEVFDESKSST